MTARARAARDPPGVPNPVAGMLAILPRSTARSHSPRSATRPARPRADARPIALAVGLTAALLLVFAITGAVTLIAPTILRDPPGYAGNALGTYVVILFGAIPVTALAMRAASRGSLGARFVWLGGVGYLLYNAILSSFALQFNELFLLYVASLSLAVWSLVAALGTIDVESLPGRLHPRFPVRTVGGYLIATALAFAALWMMDVLPAQLFGHRPASLRGTTLPTNAVQVIDFVFLSLIIAFSAKRFLRDKPIESSDPLMNRRGARLVGETALVVQAIEHGSGRVKLGDSEWIARGPDVAAGERVRISGSEGAILLVEQLTLLSDEGTQPAD